MDLEADRAELCRLWQVEFDDYDEEDPDPEIDPVAGVDPIGDIVNRWREAGGLSELLRGLLDYKDPFVRLRAAGTLWRFDHSSTPPPEAVRVLEEIAALPREIGRTNKYFGFSSYAEGARRILATQERGAEIDREVVITMAALLRSASLEHGFFVDLELEEPVDITPEARELSSALEKLATKPGDDSARIELPWFFAINVLRILGALGGRPFFGDSNLNYTGVKDLEADRLGGVIYESLKPTRDEIGEGYDDLIFILWSSGWEIIGGR